MTTTSTDRGGAVERAVVGRASARPSGARATVALAAVSSAAATLTLVPGTLTGPAVMTGSARGTALVILLVGLPMLVISTRAALRGSLGAELVRTGTTAYLLYNSVLFVFATPFNRIFLLYVAMVGLAVWSLVDGAVHVWQRAPGSLPQVPRWTAVYLAAVVVLNALAWLAKVVPAVVGEHPGDVLAGTGLTTNPVIVQDLAFWLPAMGWLALGVWRLDPPRVTLAGAGAVFWAVESLGVAVDQWWGHAADPASPVAVAAAVPLFLVLAAVGVVPARALLRSADPDGAPLLAAARLPRRPLQPTVLGVVAGLNAVAALAGAWGLASGVLDLGATIESRLPGRSTTLAGLALGLAVAVPNAVVAGLAFTGRRAGVAAQAAGLALVLWILVQLAFIRELSFFHPVYVAIGLLMVWLGRNERDGRP